MHDRKGAALPGVAQAAIQEARYVARTTVGRLEGRPQPPFVYRDRGNMAIIGRGSAIADLGKLQFAGSLAWLAWLFLHIFMLIGFRNRVAVLIDWAAAYVSFQRSSRLITKSDRP